MLYTSLTTCYLLISTSMLYSLFLYIKAKAYLSPCLIDLASCHEGTCGSGSIDPCILNVGISSQLRALAALDQGNKTH
jgi:hypothetical protein